MALGRLVPPAGVLHVVGVVVAMSVTAVSVVVPVGVLVMFLGRPAALVGLAAAKPFLCHVPHLRLRRVGSRVVAGMVNRVRLVVCRGLCRCCHGLCPVVGQSLVG